MSLASVDLAAVRSEKFWLLTVLFWRQFYDQYMNIWSNMDKALLITKFLNGVSQIVMGIIFYFFLLFFWLAVYFSIPALRYGATSLGNLLQILRIFKHLRLLRPSSWKFRPLKVKPLFCLQTFGKQLPTDVASYSRRAYTSARGLQKPKNSYLLLLLNRPVYSLFTYSTL